MLQSGLRDQSPCISVIYFRLKKQERTPRHKFENPQLNGTWSDVACWPMKDTIQNVCHNRFFIRRIVRVQMVHLGIYLGYERRIIVAIISDSLSVAHSTPLIMSFFLEQKNCLAFGTFTFWTARLMVICNFGCETGRSRIIQFFRQFLWAPSTKPPCLSLAKKTGAPVWKWLDSRLSDAQIRGVIVNAKSVLCIRRNFVHLSACLTHCWYALFQRCF